jgi:hypothetical protein
VGHWARACARAKKKRSEGGAGEIATIPRLLKVLTLEGCIVTTDAMGCQTSVAEAITEAGADYLFRLKDNHLRTIRKTCGPTWSNYSSAGWTWTLSQATPMSMEDTGGSKPVAVGQSTS